MVTSSVKCREQQLMKTLINVQLRLHIQGFPIVCVLYMLIFLLLSIKIFPELLDDIIYHTSTLSCRRSLLKSLCINLNLSCSRNIQAYISNFTYIKSKSYSMWSTGGNFISTTMLNLTWIIQHTHRNPHSLTQEHTNLPSWRYKS